MNPPDLTFRSNSSPYAILTSLTFAQTKDSWETLPVLHGETSDKIYFRIYNNWALNSNISSALNVYITTFDGIGIGSRTAVQSVASQAWVRVYQYGYGENSSQAGLFTNYIGTDTAVGGTSNIYTIEKSSDGTSGSSIRAGTDTNGVGFVEVASYAEPPDGAGSASYTFSVSCEYEYIT